MLNPFEKLIVGTKPANLLVAVLALTSLVVLGCAGSASQPGRETPRAEPSQAVRSSPASVVTATPPSPTPTPSPTPVPTPTPTPVPIRASSAASVRDDHALIVEIAVELEAPARILIEYWNPDADRFRTRPTTEAALEHSVPVFRLRADTSYTYRVYAERGDIWAPESETHTFRTGTIPNVLATLNFEITGAPTFDLMMIDVKEQFEGSYVIMLDADAQIVWYYTRTKRRISPIKQKDDFNLIYVSFKDGIYEITPFGDEVLYVGDDVEPEIIHHDLIALDDGKILYLTRPGSETDGGQRFGPAGRPVEGMGIGLYDPSTGKAETMWDWFDLLSPNDTNDLLWRTSRKRDVHSNSLSYGPQGNVIVSLRHLNQVFSISPDFGEIQWKLGGRESDFRFLDPDDRFYRQHDARQLDNGDILLFDNGNTRPEEEGGEYSRAIQLRLNFDDMTVRKVWEFRHNPDIYSDAVSGVFPMENGNRLVTFGRTPDLEETPMAVVEVDPAGRIVWEARLTWDTLQPWSYRAQIIDSVFGETRVP